MDTEFINIYIAKQKALIDDFQSRLIMQDVRHQILQSRYDELSNERVTLLDEIEKLKSQQQIKKASKSENGTF